MSKNINYGDANEVKVTFRVTRLQIEYLKSKSICYRVSISQYLRSIIDYYRFTRSNNDEHKMSDSNYKL